jgi:two-component system, sensor histidine kinase YesM
MVRPMKKLIEDWYKISLKSKLLIICYFIILFVTAISSYLMYNTYKYVDIFSTDVTSYYSLNRLQIQFSKDKEYLMDYLRSGNDDVNYKAYYENKVIIKELLQEIDRESNNTLQTYFLMNAIQNSMTVYNENCDKAISESNAGTGEQYKFYYEAAKIGGYIDGYIRELSFVKINQGNLFYNSLMAKVNRMKNITLASIFMVFVISLNLINFFSNHITKPIRKLASASMQMARGELEVKEIEVKSSDEVGVLAQSFNTMSRSIKTMVNDLKEKSDIEKKLHEEELEIMRMQQLLKETQFLALQSQINPHFLFNTLNSIARTSMFGKSELTTKLIKSLANIFRYNLRQPNKTVTLEKELEIIKEYVFIQQHRFGPRLGFELDCRMDAKSVEIPCLSLQPLLENAIIHGIEPLEAGGKIRLSVSERNKDVVIRLVDNGAGIPQDRLNKIRDCNYEGNEGHTTGIGMCNVISRLRLYFGDTCVRIKSKEGLGTAIEITIPMKKGGDTVV